MNSTKSFIAMALITSLAMQPIAAQPVEQTTEQQSKIVKQLDSSFKSFTQHLKCAVKRNCTPEQRKHIRRTALAIVGTLITLYIGKKAWKKRLDYQAEQGFKVRPDRSFKGKNVNNSRKKEEYRTRLRKLPASSSNPGFAEYVKDAKKMAAKGFYNIAISSLDSAERITKEE